MQQQYQLDLLLREEVIIDTETTQQCGQFVDMSEYIIQVRNMQHCF